MKATRAVKVTLVVGVLLLAAVCAYVLSRSPPRVLRAGPKPTGVLDAINSSGTACQGGEELPADTSAIRLSLAAYVGARVKVTVYSGSQLLTQGSRGPDWSGTTVTVPVGPLSYSASNVSVCFNVSPNSEWIYLFGGEAPNGEVLTVPGGGRLSGRLLVEDLTAGRGSWWSRVLTVARHMGLGRAFSGTWIVLLIAALVGAVGILAARLTVRELS